MKRFTSYSQIVSSVYTIYFIIVSLLHVSTLCGHHQVLLIRTITLTLDSTFPTLASVYCGEGVNVYVCRTVTICFILNKIKVYPIGYYRKPRSGYCQLASIVYS
jgi:hypothetical protein